jgi:glycosyltransferase involved in cell wall biosynthesis
MFKVGVFHPGFAYGGSEAKALWTIEALKHDYEVTLITASPVDLAGLNEYYGTKLHPGDFTLLQAPLPLGLESSTKFAALRGAFLARFLKQVARRFDVMISAYNPCDFGVRGIQFIADFSFMESWRERLHPCLSHHRRWWYGDSPLRRGYLALCNSIAPPHSNSWRHNLTIANSDWTARLLREELGIVARRVYPPVAAEFPDVPWSERENGFVCIGRVVPEKRMDAVIRILEKVRARGHDVHLHILGDVDNSPFGRNLKQLAAQHAKWVFLEGRTFGQRKTELIANHRFGINAQRNEPFGIAPAEMVKAGCVTFVPEGGGQTEIVDHPALIYKDDDEAVTKIESVLASQSLRENLRKHLSSNVGRFSVEEFKGRVRDLVQEFLGEAPLSLAGVQIAGEKIDS